MTVYDEAAMAREVAAFLYKRDSYGNRTNMIEMYVQEQVRAMAKAIAVDMVEKHPTLGDVIRGHMSRVVALALQDDAFLNRIVIDAVAAGLGKVVADRREAA